MGPEGAKRRQFGVVGDGAKDSFDGSTPTEDGAEYAVAGVALGPGIHLGSILLVFEDNGEEFGPG